MADPQAPSREAGEIDDSIFHKRSAIVDCHVDALTGFDVHHFDKCPQWEGFMRGGHKQRDENISVRRTIKPKTGAVI